MYKRQGGERMHSSSPAMVVNFLLGLAAPARFFPTHTYDVTRRREKYEAARWCWSWLFFPQDERRILFPLSVSTALTVTANFIYVQERYTSL